MIPSYNEYMMKDSIFVQLILKKSLEIYIKMNSGYLWVRLHIFNFSLCLPVFSNNSTIKDFSMIRDWTT